VVAYTYKEKLPVTYKPDFFLPEGRMYVEVKGQPPTWDERDKARRLTLVTDRPVTIVYGGMRPGQFRSMTFAIDRRGEPRDAFRLPFTINPWYINLTPEQVRQVMTEASYEKESFEDAIFWGADDSDEQQ
jgi:hypothetical protein